MSDYEEKELQEKENGGGTEGRATEISEEMKSEETAAPAETCEEITKPEETAAAADSEEKKEEIIADVSAGAAAPEVKKKKKYGGWIALGSIGAALIIAMLFFAGFGIYSLITSEGFGSGLVQSSGGGESISGDANGGATNSDFSGIDLNSRPEDNEEPSPDGKMSTTEVAELVSPTVVAIYNYGKYNSGGKETYALASSGSGIIMTEDGYIVTNAHVVDGAAKLEAVLSDGTVYDAKIVGSDVKTDIAVVKVEEKGMNYAKFGNSDQIKIGEFVLAIGNPGISGGGTNIELTGSVSFGIVSAVNRTIKVDNSTLYCIQTDAAINPGNSGGALVNMYGQVIGINSAKIQVDGYEGLGFAIAINKAEPIIRELISNGRVTSRAMLGITGTLIDALTAEQYGLEQGLMIVGISQNSDMVYRGVMVDDIITHINGEDIDSFDKAGEILDPYKPGDKVTISVFRYVRGGDNIEFDAQITLISEVDMDDLEIE